MKDDDYTICDDSTVAGQARAVYRPPLMPDHAPPLPRASPVHAGVMLTDTSGHILFVDTAFCETTGYTAEELVGKTPDVLQSGRQDSAFYRAMWQMLLREGHWQGTVWNRAKGGDLLENLLTITVAANVVGVPSHFVAVYANPETLDPTQPKHQLLAGRDSLTGLPGAAQLSVRLEMALERARADSGGVTLFLLDLDRFKRFNDRLGHAQADQLLVQVAHRLRPFLGEGDTLARSGGDEFAFLFTGHLEASAIDPLARRILEAVAKPCVVGDETVQVFACIGITNYPADHGDAVSLLRHADSALYQAKQSGSNQAHVFKPRPGRLGSGPHPLRDRLMAALERQELLLYYQPKVDLRAGEVIGVEALLRWNHPGNGVVSVGEMLAELGDDELMVRVGNWVIRRALADASQWMDHGLELSLSVNVAAAQLLHPGFVEHLKLALTEYSHFRPEHLELEILESAALDNLRRVRQVIEACREWGVRFALDDFGTGYASLAYLRDIPADVLKIDRSFVADLLDDREDRALVEGIIALARGLRRVVIAEGVENPEHAIVLMRLGCDLVQGFGIARPMPPAQLPSWVAAFKPDPQWSLWANTHWEMRDLPLLVARLDHVRWVDRVLDFVEGAELRLEMDELVDHHQCRFGNWYYHHGKERYGHLLEFGELEEVHRRVHGAGSRIVEYCRKGDVERARAHSRELLDLREQVLALLSALQESVAQDNAREKHPGKDESPLSSLADPARSATVQILVVSGVPTTIELLSSALFSDYRIKFATSGRRAVELAGLPDRPDLILLDDSIPDMQAHDVCRVLKEYPGTRAVPVILVTARNDANAQELGFAAGAVDFVAKPFDLATVRARVRTHVNLKLRTDLLEAQASLDGLTGLPNRRRFEEAIELEWRRGTRDRCALSVIMLDVDHFKAYNDAYGHAAGDECLRQVSTAMTAGLSRPGDLVARYGGEEFTIILPGCNRFGAQTIAERVRALVEALRIPHAHSPTSRFVTVSLGCCTVTPDQESSPRGLVEQADQALYRAKQDGRNRVDGYPFASGVEQTRVGP